MYYTPSWQLIEEHVAKWPGGLFDPTKYYVAQEVFGPCYIDDTVLRRIRIPTGTSVPTSLPDRWNFKDKDDSAFYHLTDVQFSTRAMMKAAVKGEVMERVRYEAYGRAHHRFDADVNEDGVVDGDDWSAIDASTAVITDSAYDVRMDLDRSGKVGTDDADIELNYEDRELAAPGQIGDTNTDPTQAAGVAPDNVFGYCGYVFAPENLLYHVRFRWYSPEHGRWLERDPAGYVDGMSLYGYVRGGVMTGKDPSGLIGPPGLAMWHRLYGRMRQSIACAGILDRYEQIYSPATPQYTDRLNVFATATGNAYRALSATDQDKLKMFTDAQMCILSAIGSCDKTNCNDPDVSQWIVDVSRDFMRPYVAALCQRSKGLPISDSGWAAFFDKLDNGTYDDNVLVSSRYKIARAMALTHINNDLRKALLTHGSGTNDAWKCIGEKVAECQAKALQPWQRAGAWGAGKLSPTWDVQSIRDRMREEVKHKLQQLE